jgi:DNA-binding response OmpR family regulator
MTMPFLSGLDVAKELRAIRPDLLVALTSGRSNQRTHAFAYSLGINTWISKPTTLDELSHALEVLLQSARNRAAPT